MSSTARQAAAVGAQTAYDIGMEGYTFPYPIALIDLTRRHMSGVVAAGQVIVVSLPSAGGCLRSVEWR